MSTADSTASNQNNDQDQNLPRPLVLSYLGDDVSATSATALQVHDTSCVVSCGDGSGPQVRPSDPENGIFEIVRQPAAVYVRTLSQPMKVNGDTVTDAWLNEGDSIEVNQWRLRVENIGFIPSTNETITVSDWQNETQPEQSEPECDAKTDAEPAPVDEQEQPVQQEQAVDEQEQPVQEQENREELLAENESLRQMIQRLEQQMDETSDHLKHLLSSQPSTESRSTVDETSADQEPSATTNDDEVQTTHSDTIDPQSPPGDHTTTDTGESDVDVPADDAPAPEMTPSQQKPEPANESVADVLARLNLTVDVDQDPVAEPRTAPSVTPSPALDNQSPAPANPSTDSDGSVEDYMSGLFQRLRGGAAPAPPPTPPPAAKPKTESRKPKPIPKASNDDLTPSNPLKVADYRPSHSAPEKGPTLDALRQVTNQSFRLAMSNQRKKKTYNTRLLYMGGTALTFLLATVLLSMSQVRFDLCYFIGLLFSVCCGVFVVLLVLISLPAKQSEALNKRFKPLMDKMRPWGRKIQAVVEKQLARFSKQR